MFRYDSHYSRSYRSFRKSQNAQPCLGLELDRAKGGVSFIYDEPPSFERWQEKREKKIKEIEGIFDHNFKTGHNSNRT